MTTAPDLDRLTLTLGDGFVFDLWEDVTISDAFLDPCQTMRLRTGADETRFGLMGRLRKGSEFLVEANGHPVLGGFLDSAEIEASREGISISVTGRDILSPVVDSNVDPRLAVKKGMSLTDLAKLLFNDHFQLPVTIHDTDAAVADGRNKALGKPVQAKPKKGRKKTTDPLKEIYPKANEGGFQYFARFAHRVGYHARALPDGKGIVLLTPTYNQEPAGELRLKRGADGRSNTIEKARVRSDNTRVPSHVYVRGKGAKPGDKSNPIGFAVNKDAPFFKPFYVTDDDSSTKDHTDAVARFVMGKALREAFTYEVTVRGFSDPLTKRIYTVDSVLQVHDEVCGVEGPMWVESRTLRKSRQGTFTDLKLIPADSLLLDYYVSDSPPPVPESYGQAADQVDKSNAWTGFEKAYAAVWGNPAEYKNALEIPGVTDKGF
jgi:prophage tail gpP-like protein